MTNKVCNKTAEFLKDFENYIAPQPVSFVECEIEVLGELSPFHEYVKETVDYLKTTAHACRYVNLPSDKDLADYMYTIINERVSRVRGQKTTLRNPRADINIPAFLNLLVSHIGRVEIPEKGIVLIPAMSESVKSPVELGDGVDHSITILNEADTLRVSARIGYLAKHGVVFAQTLPLNREGDVETMTMEIIGGQVMAGDSEAHYTKAVIAAFLGLQGYKKVLGESHFRVQYGDISVFKQLVFGLTN